MIIAQAQTISQSLSQLGTEFVNAIPSIILFVIIVIIGYVVAQIVASVIRRILPRIMTGPSSAISTDLVPGVVKALIILLALAVAFSVLNLGPATVYVAEVARYLPALAGAILLLTLGLSLVNILIDYMMKQMNTSDPFVQTIFAVLRFGIYAVIITVAATLAIFYWIPSISPYLFYDIILASVILMFAFTITDKAFESISRSDPNATTLTSYGKFILYTIFILIAVAIITQPFANVSGVLQTLAWGLAIGFGLLLIPLVYAYAKRLAAEMSR